MMDPTGKHLHHLWWGVHTAVSLLLWLPTPPDSSSEKFILGDHSCRGGGSYQDYSYLPPVPPPPRF